MLYGLLLTVFILIGFFLVIFVLIQQSKSSLGLGSMGQTQMLFGGSGGQTLFQKITWGMGGTFMLLSLVLSIMNSSYLQTRYIKQTTAKNPIVQEAPEVNTQHTASSEQTSTPAEKSTKKA